MRQTYACPLFAAFLLSIFAVGCIEHPIESREARMMSRITPPQDEASARNYVELLRERKFEEIERDLDPSLQDSRDKLSAMADLIPMGEPKSIKVVDFHVYQHPDSAKTTTITLEYEFANQWVLANLVKDEHAGVSTVSGFHLTPIQDSLENQYRFTLSGMHPAHYLILLLGCAALAVGIYGFITCLRTPMGRKKWLWAVICLVSVGRFGINWTTGASAFSLSVSVGIPPANAAMVPYGPWTVWVSFPLGAVIFLIFRDRLSRSYRVGPESRAPDSSLQITPE